MAPLVAAGAGLAAAYGTAKKPWRRIHFVEEENLAGELDEFEIQIDSVETCVECGRDIEPGEIGELVLEGEEYNVVCERTDCLDSI